MSVPTNAAPGAGAGAGAVILALVAAALATLGALLPSHDVTATFVFPPATIPERAPESGWTAPLLLARQTAERIEVALPCAAPPVLQEGPAAMVLSTAPSNGLVITRSADQYTIDIAGARVTAEVPAGPSSRPACSLRLVVTGDEYTLTGPDGGRRSGVAERAPRVAALETTVDLRDLAVPDVRVTPQAQDTQPTIAQWLTRVASLAALVLSFALVLGGTHLRRRPVRSAVAALVRGVKAVDLVVALALTVWLVLCPTFFDDGWAQVRQRNSVVSGGMSNFFDTQGANIPLGGWFEWLASIVSTRTPELVLQRVPVLALLLLTWAVVRLSVTRSLRGTIPAPRAGLWSLGTVFVVLSMAWGMTLRPEPLTALLGAVAVAAATAVATPPRGGRTPALLVLGVTIGAAVATHPAGIVVAAPALVIAPTLARWCRADGRAALAPVAVAALGAFTTAILLVFVDSDLARLRDQRAVFRASGAHSATWRTEFERWIQVPDAAELRKVAVLLSLLAIAAFATRRRRDYPLRISIAGPAALVGLLLLTLAPSKWIWHFGALNGIVAIALGVEVAVAAHEAARRETGAALRTALGVGAVLIGVLWSWPATNTWATLDLVSGDWETALRIGTLDASQWTMLLSVGTLAACCAWRIARDGRLDLAANATLLARAALPAALIPLIAFTGGALVGDARATSGWTFTRQNVDVLLGRSSCGLAGHVLVQDTRTIRALPQVFEEVEPSPPDWLASEPFGSSDVFRLTRLGRESEARTGWYRFPADRQIGASVYGARDLGARLQLEWGASDPTTGEIVTIGRGELAVEDRQPGWTVIPLSAAAGRPPDAVAVRMTLLVEGDRADDALGATALGPAVALRPRTLETLLRTNGRPTLVAPNLAPYLPCATQPVVAWGRATTPSTAVVDDNPFPIDAEQAPFAGLSGVAVRVPVLVLDDAIGRALDVIRFAPRPGWAFLDVDRSRA